MRETTNAEVVWTPRDEKGSLVRPFQPDRRGRPGTRNALRVFDPVTNELDRRRIQTHSPGTFQASGLCLVGVKGTALPAKKAQNLQRFLLHFVQSLLEHLRAERVRNHCRQ